MNQELENYRKDAVSEEGISTQKDNYKPEAGNCSNKSKHPCRIPVEHLTLAKLPESFQNKKLLKLIELMSKLTVHIVYSFSEHGSDTLKYCHGSGFIQRIQTISNTPCPSFVKDCRSKSNSTAWFKMTITTASSVFSRYNGEKPSDANVDIFYNSAVSRDRKSLPIDGTAVYKEDEDDWCVCFCATKDETLAEKLNTYIQEYEELQKEMYTWYHKEVAGSGDDKPKLVVIVGHPHGGPKMITLGDQFNKMDVRSTMKEQVSCRYAYQVLTCPGSSGSPVYICGQPISGFGYWFGHPHNHAKRQRPKDKSEINYGFSCLGTEHSQ